MECGIMNDIKDALSMLLEDKLSQKQPDYKEAVFDP